MSIDPIDLQELREEAEECMERGEAVSVPPSLLLALMDEHDEMIGEDA